MSLSLSLLYRSIPPALSPIVFLLFLSFLLYHFINLKAATEVSAPPGTDSQAPDVLQTDESREGLQEAATMMTVKVEDKEKITSNEWTQECRLLFQICFYVFCFSACLVESCVGTIVVVVSLARRETGSGANITLSCLACLLHLAELSPSSLS